ncbi:MAG TPA: energy-coupling factor transporter transmembrane component T, partial [Propionibacteriaceae bacterium]|nr:energy-coupling factor transporter transmembrane component T [Propionibacteriaceae bacterium]
MSSAVATVRSGWAVYRLPRSLHPVAWWLWALGIMMAASLTTNPLIEGLLLAAATFVVVSRRDDGPWARSFRLYAVLGAAVFVVRILYRVVFGGGDGDHVLFTLPRVPLPSVVAGIRLLGPVSLESILYGAYDGLQLGTIIVVVGAANSLASPRRLLRSLPAALYEIGTVLVVAVTVFPQLAESAARVARARRLRQSSAPSRSWRERSRLVRGLVVPVLADSLDSAISLAASMDARGFGRAPVGSRRHRVLAAVTALASVLCLMTFAYDLVSGTLPSVALGSVVTVHVRDAALVLGILGALASIRLSGHGVRRSRYRPDRWLLPELVTVACGFAPVAAIAYVGAGPDAATLSP